VVAAASAADSLTATYGATPPGAWPSRASPAAGDSQSAAAPGNFQLDIVDIPEFKPKGWRAIEGMGWLVLVDCDRDRLRDASGLAGPVKVDGKVYECIAIERTLSMRPTIHAGETIGLLLKDVG
jgi:hypothetical protein